MSALPPDLIAPPRCPHRLTPGGEYVVDALVRHEIAERRALIAMDCDDVHQLAHALAAAFVVASQDRTLADEAEEPVKLGPDRSALHLGLLVFVLFNLLTAAVAIIGKAAFG